MRFKYLKKNNCIHRFVTKNNLRNIYSLIKERESFKGQIEEICKESERKKENIVRFY